MCSFFVVFFFVSGLGSGERPVCRVLAKQK